MNINAVVVDSTPESKLEPMVFRQEEVLVSMDSEANALSYSFTEGGQLVQLSFLLRNGRITGLLVFEQAHDNTISCRPISKADIADSLGDHMLSSDVNRLRRIVQAELA